ncbi:hypothetical protein M0R45_009798 [Rubus argutus]|uniref:Pectinesterase n=1 Tax=Rubus argutus TaxID=59490 RepID=A0AAW1Y824_RUBAR
MDLYDNLFIFLHAHRQRIVNWINATGGTSSAFDVTTKDGMTGTTHQGRRLEFGEYECRGKGADRRGRVPWLKSFSPEEIRPFLNTTFICGEQWLKI